MGFAETARQLDGSLSASSRLVLNALLAEPKMMAALSATQVAARVGVHETTVIRLANQLGYSGYRQLRESLAADGEAPITSFDRIRSRDTSAYTLAALIEDEAAAMMRLARLVSQEEIDELAQRILECRRVYLFGPPYAQQVVATLDRRLRRLGIDAVALPLSGRLIAEQLTTMKADDLLISFVFRKPDPRMNRIMAYCASVGAATAIIADDEGLVYESRPDQLIVAPRGPTASQRSLIVPLIVSYAIQFALHHLAKDRTERALEVLDDLARVVGDDEPSHAT